MSEDDVKSEVVLNVDKAIEATSETGVKMSELFDIEAISQSLLLEDNGSLYLNIRRADRELFEVRFEARVHLCESITSQFVHARFIADDMCGYIASKKLIKECGIERNNEICALLENVMKVINSYQECYYCKKATRHSIVRQGAKVSCQMCSAYSFNLVREKCIACTKKKHPTKFKCITCTHSIVCLKCAHNPDWKNVCPTCKLPEKPFGTKRKASARSDDDEDDEEDPEQA
jgi:hypothetical protein